MRLGITLLALIGCCAAAQECLVGNVVVDHDVIVSKSVEYRECEGLCRKQSILTGGNSLVLFSCEDNKMEAFLNQGQSCDEKQTETSCYCAGNRCNNLDLAVNIAPPAQNDVNVAKCYVGFNAYGNTNQGDTVMCSAGSACSKVNATYSGYFAEIYACMPVSVCQQVFPNTKLTGTDCGTLPNSNIQACCCYDSDCTSLVSPGVTVPTPSPFGKNNVTCYQGIAINGQSVYGGGFSQCLGECGSARIRTTYNNQVVWGEVFVCDPVNIFTSINLNNQCKTIDTTNINGVPSALIVGCACNTDKCLDPTVVPPVYPTRELKCAVGLYNGTNWLGAEMNCQGRCGRVKFTVNGAKMAYYSCSPYDVCAGFGLESSEGLTYNPPQDEEIEAYCCSASNNCNADQDVIINSVNTSAVSTVNYPILCYGGIWVNGVPITNSAYGFCQGECASVNFLTTFAGQTHNATIYTCDPVTMCQQAGIRSSCGQISTNVTACCCGNDLCIDPNRGTNAPQLRCYSGISIPEDGFNAGGDQLCNGWCGSLNSVVNSKNTTVYFCSPPAMCRYYGLGFGGSSGNCASINGADPPVSGCCCSDSDNCLVPANVNVTALPARKDPKIVCYEGLHINGDNVTFPYYRICDGECVSVQMGGTINGTTHFATLYTCDPASACQSLGIRNNCSLIDNSVSACCCDSDECIDPTVNRVPGTVLKCYVGVKALYANVSIGAEVECNGYCSSVTGVVGSDVYTAFHCAPRSICRSLGLDNSNTTIFTDRYLTADCCDYADYCNVIGKNVNLTGLTVQPKEAPKACYQGVFVNYTSVSNGGWAACQGDCASITMNTTVGGKIVPATVYSCDPSTVCRQLGVLNKCQSEASGLEACCCDSDACLDPTVSPPKKPNGPGNLCYVGVYSYTLDSSKNPTTILNVGGDEVCYGTCASITGNVGSAIVSAYACVPNTVCNTLGLYNDCQQVYTDRTITGCCCSSYDDCNTDQTPLKPPPTPRAPIRREYPITCPAGVYVNGAAITPVNFQVCAGDCASLTITGTVGNTTHTATLYSCDPSSVCAQLGVRNNCSSPETGVLGCCCDSDACLDPVNNKTVPTPPLKCYVGFYSSAVQTGAEVMCDGKCAALSAPVYGDNVTIFSCVPHKLCRSLELYDSCYNLAPTYAEYQACCCDNYNNCNVDQAGLTSVVNTSIPLSKENSYPITCYSGLFLNGTAYSDGGWVSCQGECASVSISSSFRGIAGTAALYTCDPTKICRTLNIVNNCTSLENGLSGCCCNTDACLDPTKFPAKTPGNPLMCFAGVVSNYTNPQTGRPMRHGGEILCDGVCTNVTGIVAGYNVQTYHCSPKAVCRSIGLYDNCRRIHEDRKVDVCCCDNSNNCNIQGTSINPGPPPRAVEYAIACYSGLYVNGLPVSDIILGACRGQCSSMSLTTTYMNSSTTATLYGCDPTFLCDELQIQNKCTSPEPGLTGCCCNTDLCLDPPKNRTVPAGTRTCYSGVYAQGQANGGEIACNGKCTSLSTTLNNDSVTIFGCAPDTVCRQMELYDACSSIFFDRAVGACCCDNYDNCNVDQVGLGKKINTTTMVSPQRNFPISCYSGVFIDGMPYADGGWQSCQGECGSASVTTSLNGRNHTATLYTCDPLSTCANLGLTNNCTIIETGLEACCCGADACLDPTVVPPKKPGKTLTCYVGIHSDYMNVSRGGEAMCNGKCASLSGTVQNVNVTAYYCVPNNVCQSLELYDSCKQIYQYGQNNAIQACCCDNADNCNVKDPNIPVGPITPNTDFPIACYSGIAINGVPYGDLSLSTCYGDCSSVSLTSSYMNVTATATIYGCDPTKVCNDLNLSNGCHSLQAGVTGCCCSSDTCINPYTGEVPGPKQCYVGIYTSDGKVNAGANVPCPAGYCGSLSTNVGGVFYKSYHCVPKTICHQLELNNVNRTLALDQDITASCCTTGSNCHVTEKAVNTSSPIAPWTGGVIACRNAVYINGASVADDFFTACAGQCGSVSYNTTYNNQQNTLTMYGCDPTSVCDSLGLKNSCQSLDVGLTGCCCTTDNCLGPDHPVPTPQGGASSSISIVFALFLAVYIAVVRQ